MFQQNYVRVVKGGDRTKLKIEENKGNGWDIGIGKVDVNIYKKCNGKWCILNAKIFQSRKRGDCCSRDVKCA
jgi:hypothetical protein